MSVIPWSVEETVLNAVNGAEYVLTAAIITNDLAFSLHPIIKTRNPPNVRLYEAFAVKVVLIRIA